MIDHATHARCHGIRVHTRPTRSDSLVNSLHYKKEKKKKKNIFNLNCHRPVYGMPSFTSLYYN